MTRLPLSVAIITHNEERTIARALESVAWADEIVLVDSHSSDSTARIAKDPRAPWAAKLKFEDRAWQGFRAQRNFSLARCTHDWVLVLDSDEACSPELAARLQALLAEPGGPSAKAYKVRRQEYFLGKPIHYGVWNPSYQDRFFFRHGVEYINEVHEYPRFPSAPERLHEPILHDPGFDVERFLSKMNRYTTVEARERFAAGQRTHLVHLAGAFFAMVWKNFVYYRAYRDGMPGFVISLLEGVSRVVRHIKLWQLERGARSG